MTNYPNLHIQVFCVIENKMNCHVGANVIPIKGASNIVAVPKCSYMLVGLVKLQHGLDFGIIGCPVLLCFTRTCT